MKKGNPGYLDYKFPVPSSDPNISEVDIIGSVYDQETDTEFILNKQNTREVNASSILGAVTRQYSTATDKYTALSEEMDAIQAHMGTTSTNTLTQSNTRLSTRVRNRRADSQSHGSATNDGHMVIIIRPAVNKNSKVCRSVRARPAVLYLFELYSYRKCDVI